MRKRRNDAIVVPAVRARANFGKLLERIEDERLFLAIEKRGSGAATAGCRHLPPQRRMSAS